MNHSAWDKQVIIITGGFGSGKSEYAINLSLDLVRRGPLALVDLDLVNAYFRSREARGVLESQGIKAVLPPERIINSDFPIAGPGIKDLIADGEVRVVIDVGGDNMGATALGTYRQEILKSDHIMLLVVNPYRPFTCDLSGIIQMKAEIEDASGLKVTGLISNPNAGGVTTARDVIEKHKLVELASRSLNIPILEILFWEKLQLEMAEYQHQLDIPLRPLKIHLFPEWLMKQYMEGAQL